MNKIIFVVFLSFLAQLFSQAGNALSFDGINDYVNISSSITSSTTTKPITVEAWVYPTSNADVEVILSKYKGGDSGQSNFMVARGTDEKLLVAGNGTNSFTSTGTLPLYKWTYIAVVFKAGTDNTKIYISGALDKSGTLNYNTSNSTSNMRIGEFVNIDSYSVYQRWSGTIDELRLWNYARTATQIIDNMNTPQSGSETGLAAYYDFNQGIAYGDNSGINTLADLTGNGFNGILLNFALTGTTSNWVEGYSLNGIPPLAPIATDASNVAGTSFTANWNSSEEAQGYLLDVSTEIDFSSCLPDYQNRNVGNVNTFTVTVTSGLTDYYYRLRAYNSAGPGEYSNSIEVTTTPVFTSAAILGVQGTNGVMNSSVAWGDYDNDGDLDILLTGANYRDDDAPSVGGFVSIIYRNDSGNFSDIQAGLTGVYDGSASWGDYDNDGDLDILLTGRYDWYYDRYNNLISKVYRNDDGVFTDINAGLINVCKSSVDWGDYDNDGDLDILLTGRSTSGAISKIYRNNSGIFTDINAGLIGVSFSSASWSDYDNDGDLDILLTGSSTSGAISKIYRNDSGLFTDINAGLIGVSFSSAAWGDYDNDGDSDILISGYSEEDVISEIYRNDNGVFTDINAGLIGIKNGSVDWGDYDNDGDLDILLTGENESGNRISRTFSNDSGNFNDTDYGLTAVTYSSAAWGDYDKDGDLDIILTGIYKSHIEWWYDQGNPVYSYTVYNGLTNIYRNDVAESANVRPDSPVNLSSTVNNSAATLSWEKASDAETPQNGLSYNIFVGSSSLNGEIRSSMSDVNSGYRKIVNSGNAGENTSVTINNLLPGLYYWSVQAIDHSFSGSRFSTQKMFVIGEEPEGSGTSESPYLIHNLNNLLWICSNSSSWSKNFIQTAEIDAYDSRDYWKVIGSELIPFTGSYDGQSYSIKNLYIDAASEYYVGLFGYIDSATVKDIQLTNADITGYRYTGSLVGYANASTITNINCSGTVNCGSNCGGVVGYNCNTSIDSCSFVGNVTGSYYCGGLVGYNTQYSVIDKCFSEGSLTGIGTIGGITGINSVGSQINNSYSRTSVSGDGYVGGYVGSNNASIVVNSYSVGSVSATSSPVGGLVGANSNGATVANSFWDIETSGMSSSNGGTGKTTAQMKTISTFADEGWDFAGETVNGTEEIWDMISYFNGGYPYLSWQDVVFNAPANVTITAAGTDAAISWDSQPDSDSYSIYSSSDPYASFPGGWNTEVTGLTETSWTDTNATDTRKFYIVTAVKALK